MTDNKRQRRIEMGAFGLALVIVIALLGGLIWLEQPGQPEAPLVTARIVQVERRDQQLIVRFELSNQGTLAAESVRVSVTVPPLTSSVDQTIMYLPVGTSRRGVATFYEVPDNAAPVARVMGYMLP